MKSSRFIRQAGLILPFLFTTLLSAQGPITHQITLSNGETWCSDSMINGLFSQINGLRQQKGLPALSMDSVGMHDAEIRATQVIDYFANNAPNSPGFNPHQGYDTTAASLGYNLVGENLAWITVDPVNIVYNIWQDPLHLAAMLAAGANAMGVSCVFSPSGTPYWTYEPGCSGGTCGQAAPPPPSVPTVDSEEWAFLSLINNFRQQNGAGPLQISVALETSSQWMSNDMATNNYISHTDSLGRNPGARFAAFNYPYSPWGENIAAGYTDAQSVFNGWLNACDADATGTCTYAHRQNMLNGSFVVIGIGRAYNASSSYGWYWTTDFGGVVDQIISPPSPTVNPPTINSFVSSPSTITAGQSALLSWTITGASTISLNNGIGDVSALTSKSVAPAQTTTYTLTASNAGGSVTASVTVTVNAAAPPDVQPPTTPTLISAVAKSQAEVDLNWGASTDNVGVTGYQILRNGSILSSVSGTTLAFADTTVNPSTSYIYSVKAFDAAGNFSAASNSVQVTTPAPPSLITCPSPAVGAFTGCYYNGTDLTGNPALVRTDSQINFTWGSGSPSSAITPRNFSVRWQGVFQFAAGAYTFTAMVSDGMRFYIDGIPVRFAWRDQSPSLYAMPQTLTQGNHLLTLEYYEDSGNAQAVLSWNSPSAPPSQAPSISAFTATPSTLSPGQNTTLAWNVSGATTIAIDNGVGDVSGLSSKVVAPSQTTTYTLTASNTTGTSTAHVVVTVNSAPDTQPPTVPTLVSAVAKSSGEVDLTWTASQDNIGVAGYQILRNGSAIASVSGSSLLYADSSVSPGTLYTYSVNAFDAAGNHSAASNTMQVSTPAAPALTTCPGPAVGAFTGCYYNNVNLTGNPVLVRTDNQINFTWGNGSPAAAVTPMNFSVQWQGIFNFAQGNYTFSLTSSDGMRLYIDGNPVRFAWRDEVVSVFLIPVTLSQGNHLITLEYYEETGTATAILSWQKN